LSGEDPLYVGLMSGTSVDAIDSALVRCGNDAVVILATHQHALPLAIKQQIAALSHSGPDEIEQAGILDRELGMLFAEATLQLLATAKMQPKSGRSAATGRPSVTVRRRLQHVPWRASVCKLAIPTRSPNTQA
jgi:anhydro-N-acetylmuramic acid kinase